LRPKYFAIRTRIGKKKINVEEVEEELEREGERGRVGEWESGRVGEWESGRRGDYFRNSLGLIPNDWVKTLLKCETFLNPVL